MFKRLFAPAAILAIAVTTNAAITADLVDLDQPLGPGTATYDVVVTLTSDDYDADDWTAARICATLSGDGEFIAFDYSCMPPPVLCYPWIYGSFFTSPQWYPNSDDTGFVQYPDDPPVEEVQLRSGEWFDTADTGNGTFVINRLSAECTEPGADCWMHIELEVSAANTGGELFSYTFDVRIPEPAGFLMLAFGSLSLFRRR